MKAGKCSTCGLSAMCLVMGVQDLARHFWSCEVCGKSNYIWAEDRALRVRCLRFRKAVHRDSGKGHHCLKCYR